MDHHRTQPGSDNKTKMSAGKMKVFLRKYFWEGQKLTEKQTKALENLNPDASFAERLMVKHRRLVTNLENCLENYLEFEF